MNLSLEAVRAAADRIRSGGHPSATFVVNPDWARGQTTSMQCGLRAVPPDADGVLFTLVDHPAVAPTTIDALLAGPRAAHAADAGGSLQEQR